MSTKLRKGARSIKDIPGDILDQLNRGEIETANLVEWLAVDQKLLLKNLLAQLNRTPYLKALTEQLASLQKQTVTSINHTIGTSLFRIAAQHQDTGLLPSLSQHPSDLVRCWATHAIGSNPGFTIREKLNRIRVFAADHHFGVREIAWMAVRPAIAEQLLTSIDILANWTQNEDPHIRRFATESTRPRGVWCAHIAELKEHPELGLPILEPLYADESRYVQDSVSNWLNDAGKTRSEFVKTLCSRWEKKNPTGATRYIIRRALRSFKK